MRRYILYILILLLVLGNANAQSFLPLNTAYYQSPLITFHNPAPLALVGHPHAAVGVQLLHVGFAEDNLRNNFFSLVWPFGSTSAIGLRTQYFTSNIYQQVDFSLLVSQRLYRDLLMVGFNANLINHGFDKDKFELFDFHDPVIQNGTSKMALSYGFSLFSQPVSGLYIGFSADHFNEPDISLDKSSVLQRRIYNFGFAYCKLPVVPQIDVRMEGEEILTQASLRKSLFNDKLELLAGYNQFEAGGSNLFAQAEFKFGDLGLLYSFQNPLTDDLAGNSNGSHLVGIFYTKSEPPSIPEITLVRLKTKQFLPQIELEGEARNKDGLTYIEIFNNDELVNKIDTTKKKVICNIKQPIQLIEGENLLKVVAHSSKTSSTKEVPVLFEPQAPVLNISSLKNSQTKNPDYELRLNISDQIGLDRLQIIHNDQELVRLTNFTNKNEVELSRQIGLKEGENQFKIIATNDWRVTSDSLWIVYRPAEAPPDLKIDSPQRPISSSSSIVVNLQLDNYEQIKEIVIKVNGNIVDTVNVETSRPVRTRDFHISEPNKYSRTINLNSAKNIVEAIALDESKSPRTSKTMDILYNPYAEEMKSKRTRAIIIGIDNYRDEKIPQLDKAVSDARSFVNVLNDNFKFDRIDTLINEKATFENMNAMLSDSLLQASRDEFILVYFSGHGDQIANESGESIGYIIPHDAGLTSVSKRITMTFIRDYAIQSPAKHILYIIDACFSGISIIEKPTISYDEQECVLNFELLKNQVKKRTRNIISAGGKGDLAIDGLFTQILNQGLMGAADCNQDHYISFTELALYVQQHVSDIARTHYNRKQNPQHGSIIVDSGECVFEQKAK